MLPVLKDLGLHWLTLDDHWFDHYGDWNPRHDSFPGGAEQMRRMVEKIHQAGALAQIWWYPLCVEDGHGNWDDHPYGISRLLRQHPDWLVLNGDGSAARNNRQLPMLCPALPEVQEYTLKLVRLFIEDWGFDGHKLDNIYCMAACHNPAHQHTHPEDSLEAFAGLYRQILEETRRLRPDSVTQICPCGTPITHTLLPAVDQTVTADPTSSAQIRQRIKFYKALTGPAMPVFADHVELSDGGADFASEIGAGGIPATKFILPPDGYHPPAIEGILASPRPRSKPSTRSGSPSAGKTPWPTVKASTCTTWPSIRLRLTSSARVTVSTSPSSPRRSKTLFGAGWNCAGWRHAPTACTIMLRIAHWGT